MPTEVKANELKDVDVQFVSLVKRGANRIPFRLTKKDVSGMIDFNRIFRKAEGADDDKKAAILKEEPGAAVVPGTMPIPTTPEAAVAAATALLKQNGYNVMLAQANSVTAQPAADTSNAADDKNAKGAEGQDKGAAGAGKTDKEKVEKTDAEKAAELVAAKKAEIAKAQSELVELEKGAAQKSNPASTPAVNASNNKEDGTAKGVTMPGGKEVGGDKPSEEISDDPEIDKDGSEEKKKTYALMAKLEESMAALTTLVKTSNETTEKRLTGVEAKVTKSDAVIVAKVLGAAPDDATPANVRKAASSAPPLLDTGLSGPYRFS